MFLHRIARKLQRNLEDYGWWVTLKKSVASFFGPIYERQIYRLYRIKLESAPCERFDPSGFTFKILNEQDDSAIHQIEELAEWFAGELKERIARSGVCLVALDKGKVAGFNLIAFGEVYIPLIRLTRTFRPGEAWSEHIAVHKDYRKRGLASQLRYGIFAELKRRNIQRLYGGTLSFNEAALKLTRRVGFREFVDVHYFRVLGFKCWRYKRVRN